MVLNNFVKWANRRDETRVLRKKKKVQKGARNYANYNKNEKVGKKKKENVRLVLARTGDPETPEKSL